MSHRTTRRRFLAISAAACLPFGSGIAAGATETRWRGAALGAAASLRIVGLAPADAAPILEAVEAELRRLEDIFSLYRPGSALSRLNAEGRLAAPPAEMLELLSLANALNLATGGAFDPTVQPLFVAHARAASENRSPSAREIDAARELMGWQEVRFDASGIRLLRAGAGLSLNGVAQGYITDRVAALLKSYGLTNVLVDAGEVAALGERPGGGPWSAGVAAPDGSLVRRLALADRALATSAPFGTVLDPLGRLGHIFDPARGAEAIAARLVAVSAPTAAVADGLSTALCVLPGDKRSEAVGAFAGARLEVAI